MDNFVRTFIDEAKEKRLKKAPKEKREEVKSKYENPRIIISEYAKNASRLYKVSHCSKFTHTKSRTSNARVEACNSTAYLLETNGTEELDIWCAAQYQEVCRFLMNKDSEGKSLLEYIEKDDYSPFDFIECGSEEKKGWYERFKQVKNNVAKEVIVDKYAKQILFPIDNSEYLTLIPLFPTSLYGQIHAYIDRIKKDYKDARKNKRDNKPYEGECREIFGLAVQEVGGDNPQNASYLNAQRNGRIFLLDSAAPRLEFKPIYIRKSIKSIFDYRELHFRVRKPVNDLMTYNKAIKNYDKNYSLRQAEKHFVAQAFFEIYSTLSYLKDNLEEGWTDEYEDLKYEHKVFIDIQFKDIGNAELIRCRKVLVRDFKQFITPKLKEVFDDLDLKDKDLYDELWGDE